MIKHNDLQDINYLTSMAKRSTANIFESQNLASPIDSTLII